VHLVGLTVGIYYDARNYERQIFGFSDIGPEENSFKKSILLPCTLKIGQFPNLKWQLDRLTLWPRSWTFKF
jgi:hypothetical protein